MKAEKEGLERLPSATTIDNAIAGRLTTGDTGRLPVGATRKCLFGKWGLSASFISFYATRNIRNASEGSSG